MSSDLNQCHNYRQTQCASANKTQTLYWNHCIKHECCGWKKTFLYLCLCFVIAVHDSWACCSSEKPPRSCSVIVFQHRLHIWTVYSSDCVILRSSFHMRTMDGLMQCIKSQRCKRSASILPSGKHFLYSFWVAVLNENMIFNQNKKIPLKIILPLLERGQIRRRCWKT